MVLARFHENCSRGPHCCAASAAQQRRPTRSVGWPQHSLNRFKRLEELGKGPGFARVINGGWAVGAIARVCGSVSARWRRVPVDRPVMQRTDPRGFIGESSQDFCVIEGKNFIGGTVVAEAGAEADPNGRVNLLELLM